MPSRPRIPRVVTSATRTKKSTTTAAESPTPEVRVIASPVYLHKRIVSADDTLIIDETENSFIARVNPDKVGAGGSVSGQGSISVASGVVSSEALDQINANQRSAVATLSDASVTLSVAGGRRYRIPPNTLTSTRRTITLDPVGAEAEDWITIDRRDASAWPLQIVSAGVMLTMVNRRGLYRFRFDGTAWLFDDHQARMRIFNVVDYGARGDEFYSGLSTSVERAAIQAAIDAAAAYCRNNNGTGAVVDFGSGYYRVDGELIMRRTPREHPIIYRGDGAVISHQGSVATDLFRVESLAEEPNLVWGGYGHVFEGLQISGGARCFVWDLGFPGDYGFQDGVRAQIHFRRCTFDGDAGGPLVRIVASSRTRFFDCDVDPFYFKQGNVWVELLYGSASFYGCQGGGAFLRARSAGEIYMFGCRPEGATLTPFIDLYDTGGFVLSGGSSEGHDEGDCLIRMEGCKYIDIDGFVMANTDRSYVRARGRIQFAGVVGVFEQKSITPYKPSPLHQFRRTDGGSWFAGGLAYGAKVKFTSGSALNTGLLTVKEMTHDTLVFEESVVVEGSGGSPLTVGGTAAVYNTALPAVITPTVTYNAAGKTLTRDHGSWLADGFVGGSVMQISRTNAANTNNKGYNGGGPYGLTIVTATDLVLTVAENITDEVKVQAQVEADYFGAGLVLKDCSDFDIRLYSAGSFKSAGAQNRYGVEVDADCHDGNIRFAGPGLVSLGQQDVLVDPDAVNVHVEYNGIDGTLAPVTYRNAKNYGVVNATEIQTPKLSALDADNLEVAVDVGQFIIHTVGGVTVATTSYSVAGGRVILAHQDDTQINYTGFVSIEPSTFASISAGTYAQMYGGSYGIKLTAEGRCYIFTASSAPDKTGIIVIAPSSGTPGDTPSNNEVYFFNDTNKLKAKIGAAVVPIAGGERVVAADGTTVTFDFNTGIIQEVTLGGNRTLAFSNLRNGARYTITLIQDGTGSHTVTWPSTAKFPNGTAPTLTTTAAAKDIFFGYSDGTNIYFHNSALDVR